MSQFFVTGTGTGVGKTYVSCVLARRGVAAGRRVFAFKPLETGCERIGAQRVGSDQEALARAAGDWQRGELRNLYCFEHPLAPLMAAQLEGREVDLDRVKLVFLRGAAGADVVVVEGAGGWRVPITKMVDMGGLAKLLSLPVIIVATAGLGTINHTLLTIEAVRRDGCELAGVLLSVRPEDDARLARANADEIHRVAELRTHPELIDVGGVPGLMVCGVVSRETPRDPVRR